MFFEEVLVNLLEGFLFGEDSTSFGLEMVVVIIAGGKYMKSALSLRQAGWAYALCHRGRALGASRGLNFGHHLRRVSITDKDTLTDCVDGPAQ